MNNKDKQPGGSTKNIKDMNPNDRGGISKSDSLPGSIRKLFNDIKKEGDSAVRRGRQTIAHNPVASATASIFTRSVATAPTGGFDSARSLPNALDSSDRSDGSRKSAGGRVENNNNNNNVDRAFQEMGTRMKMAFNRMRQRGNDDVGLACERRTSRRRRSSNSLSVDDSVLAVAGAQQHVVVGMRRQQQQQQRGAGISSGNLLPMGYVQLRAANGQSFRSDASNTCVDNPLSEMLLRVAGKENFCDVEIIAGNDDDVAVRAPGFLLACHSTVFEGMFYPKEKEEGEPSSESPARHSIASQSNNPRRRRVRIEFASRSAVEAAVHFCASLELPPDLENDANNESNVRAIAQLHLLARLYRIRRLADETYQAARRAMNRDPTLACAAFDECIALSRRAEAAKYWGLMAGTAMGKEGTRCVVVDDDLKDYALGCLRESPDETLMAQGPKTGLTLLSASSIEAIVCDQEIDVDEYGMWCILNMWVKSAPGTPEDKIACAKSVASHIKLIFIDPMQLKHQVKKCGFIDPDVIEEALKEIEFVLENETTNDKERVVVEGAGDERVNGVYVLADDEVGLKQDEVMFLKEAEEGDFSGDLGLFLWGEAWGISSCIEYFNLLYSCKVDVGKGHSRKKPPKWGWKCGTGAAEAPTCTWKPGKERQKKVDASKLGTAPALSAHKSERKRVVNSSSQRKARMDCGHCLAESLTLSQMMELPEDEDYRESDQRYASGAKDLAAMMNMSVDEGHEDEEGGYDVNYLSATLCAASFSDIKNRSATPSG